MIWYSFQYYIVRPQQPYKAVLIIIWHNFNGHRRGFWEWPGGGRGLVPPPPRRQKIRTATAWSGAKIQKTATGHWTETVSGHVQMHVQGKVWKRLKNKGFQKFWTIGQNSHFTIHKVRGFVQSFVQTVEIGLKSKSGQGRGGEGAKAPLSPPLPRAPAGGGRHPCPCFSPDFRARERRRKKSSKKKQGKKREVWYNIKKGIKEKSRREKWT